VSFWPALAIALLAYGVACAALWRFQTRFVFYPLAKLSKSPAAFGTAFQDVTIPTVGGSLHGWWMAADPTAPVILYLHGNGGNIGAYASQACRLRNLGYSVLIIDYRGYGQSSGPFPAESRVYEDAEAAWNWLIQPTNESAKHSGKGIPGSQICIYGHSLGGAVAIELARHHPNAAALIVESSFTSALALGRHMQVFRIFPISALLAHRFESIAKLNEIRMPVLFMHGTRDLTVPCRMSRELFAVAPDPKQFVIFEGASHMNCGETNPSLYRQTVTSFLSGAFAQQNPPIESKTETARTDSR
jgi:pimeloyl-ACP methyl ester carboxylesterase